MSRSAAARSRSPTIRSHVRNEAPTSSVGPGAGSSVPSPARTPRHGHSGGAPSSCEQRPSSTRAPLASARAAISAPSRDLPMPGSPVRTAKAGDPPSACCRAPTRAPTSCSRPARGQPAGGTTTAVVVAGSGAATVASGVPGAGGDQARSGSWRSSAVSRSRTSGDGSRASSLSSTSRSSRRVASASAWRPLRWRATARSAQNRSRRGCCEVSFSNVTAAAVCLPSASSAVTRSSTATSRSSSSRVRSGTAAGASPSSAYGIPRQPSSATSRSATTRSSSAPESGGGPQPRNSRIRDRHRATVASKARASTRSSGTASEYPGATVTSTVDVPRRVRPGSSTRRRWET